MRPLQLMGSVVVAIGCALVIVFCVNQWSLYGPTAAKYKGTRDLMSRLTSDITRYVDSTGGCPDSTMQGVMKQLADWQASNPGILREDYAKWVVIGPKDLWGTPIVYELDLQHKQFVLRSCGANCIDEHGGNDDRQATIELECTVSTMPGEKRER
jgi:hypothetical protein